MDCVAHSRWYLAFATSSHDGDVNGEFAVRRSMFPLRVVSPWLRVVLLALRVVLFGVSFIYNRWKMADSSAGSAGGALPVAKGALPVAKKGLSITKQTALGGSRSARGRRGARWTPTGEIGDPSFIAVVGHRHAECMVEIGKRTQQSDIGNKQFEDGWVSVTGKERAECRCAGHARDDAIVVEPHQALFEITGARSGAHYAVHEASILLCELCGQRAPHQPDALAIQVLPVWRAPRSSRGLRWGLLYQWSRSWVMVRVSAWVSGCCAVCWLAVVGRRAVAACLRRVAKVHGAVYI